MVQEVIASVLEGREACISDSVANEFVLRAITLDQVVEEVEIISVHVAVESVCATIHLRRH